MADDLLKSLAGILQKVIGKLMRISVFGMGYVGIVTSACLAKLGHKIIGIDTDPVKLAIISKGESPIYEEGLNALLKEALKNNLFSITRDYDLAIKNSDISIVCVGTPSNRNGAVDTSYLETVIAQISSAINKYKPSFYFVINRSTCDINAHFKCMEILNNESGRKIGPDLGYSCHPEFLREGDAIYDFFNPPKIVFGISDRTPNNILKELYIGINAPTFFTSIETSSFVKYADNAFHAVKVTFANEIGLISKEFNVNSSDVMKIFCMDTKLNISTKYLMPGSPFGGSCLPKDIRSMLSIAESKLTELKMLKGAIHSNDYQIDSICKKIVSYRVKNVGFIGIAFKESTDDIRESPALRILKNTLDEKINVCIYDVHLSNSDIALDYFNSLIDSPVECIKKIQDIINKSDLLVISHKLNAKIWNEVNFPPNVCVLDLIGVECIKSLDNYEGLYW
jgi:GDP-mannose 6-dehydrogenase